MTAFYLLFAAPVLLVTGMYACPRLWRSFGPERHVDRGGFGLKGDELWGSRGG